MTRVAADAVERRAACAPISYLVIRDTTEASNGGFQVAQGLVSGRRVHFGITFVHTPEWSELKMRVAVVRRAVTVEINLCNCNPSQSIERLPDWGGKRP